MILEYVWIEDYRVIKSQGFNFNPNVKYNFNPETLELHKEVSNVIPDNFFHLKNDTVTCVNALVGENGSGKSTALEFISRFLTSQRPLGGFIITSTGIINKSDKEIRFSPDWPLPMPTLLNRLDLINIYRRESGYEDLRDTIDTKNDPLGLRILENFCKDTRLIYYSGVANLEHTNRVYQSLLSMSDEYENSHYTDISDISLISKDQRRYRSDKAVYSGENPILAYRSGEAQRFLELMWSNQNDIIPFPLENLSVAINFNDIDDAFFSSYDNMAFKAIFNLLNSLFEVSKTKLSESTKRLITDLGLYGIGGFFNQKLHEYKEGKSRAKSVEITFYHHLLLRHLREQLMETIGELTVTNKAEEFLSFISDIEKAFSNDNQYLSQIKNYLKNTRFAYQITGSLKIDSAAKFINSIIKLNIWGYDSFIGVTTKDGSLNKFIDLLKKLDTDSGLKYKVSTIFDIDIRGLSTGEKQFLKIFSRFIAFNLSNRDNSLKETQFIILLDEFDIGFHPLWQQDFLITWIKFLEDFINQKTGSKIQVQLIISTHSPFLVSDLPKQCINFTKKDEKTGQSKVDELKQHDTTFGANIHSLFTDAFFLKNSLIGEFAREKIDSLINQVNQKDEFTAEEYVRLKSEIDIIGEPFIRYKLTEKILMGLPKQDFDNALTEREKELELFRKIRK